MLDIHTRCHNSADEQSALRFPLPLSFSSGCMSMNNKLFSGVQEEESLIVRGKETETETERERGRE